MSLGLGFVAFIFSLVFSHYSNQQSRRAARRQKKRLEELENRGHLINTKSTDFVYPLIYGPGRVGGNRVYEATSGESQEVYGLYYHQILNIGMGPLNGIYREDDTIWTTTGTQLPTSNPPLIYLDGVLWTETNMVDNCYFEWFNGSSDQTLCTKLAGYVPQWNLLQRHKAYLYCRFTYDKDKFLGVPDVTVKVAGLKCYDPTAETISYTTNFALHVYDMLTRPKELGGLNLDNWMAAPPSSPRIDVSSVEDCRSYCETKGWKGGLVINENQDFVDNIDLILDCFRGDIITSYGNKFKMQYRDLNYESIAMDLEESDIVRRNNCAAIRIRPRATTFRRPNAIDANHFSSELNYQKHNYLYTDSDAISSDNDIRKLSINLLGLNDLDTLQKMLNYVLERARWGNAVDIEARHHTAQLEPGNLITLTHSDPNYSSQKLRVNSVSLGSNETVALSCEEEADALYDDSYNPAEIVRYVPEVVDLSSPPPGVINITIGEETFSVRGRTFTKLMVDFDPPANYPWFHHANIWLRKGISGDWKYITKAESDWEYALVDEGYSYYVKLQSVNILDIAEDFDSANTVSKEISGLLSVYPSDVSGFTAAAAGDKVSFHANNPGYTDIVGWEIRFGNSWDNAIFMTLLLDPSYIIAPVRPGTHTFWSAIKSNAGIYSETPKSVTVKIFISPGFSLAHNWSWDFTTGSHDNTEHDTYDSQDILKCSHTGGVLTGTWTSPTYDMTSIKKVRIWGDFTTEFIDSANTWTGISASTKTWTQIEATTKKWIDLIEFSSAAAIESTLYASENGSDWDEYDFFQILCAEVEARYLKIDVIITDPSDETNLYLYELDMYAYTGPT